jgi:hypothetical protein
MAKDKRLRVRMTASEYEQVKRLAEQEGMDISKWVRSRVRKNWSFRELGRLKDLVDGLQLDLELIYEKLKEVGDKLDDPIHQIEIEETLEMVGDSAARVTKVRQPRSVEQSHRGEQWRHG